MMHAACRFKHVGALSEAAYGLYSVGTSSPQNRRTLLQYLTCKLPACLLLMLLPPLLSDYKGVRCVRELGAGPSRENELRLVNLDVAFTAGGPGFVRLSCCFQPCDPVVHIIGQTNKHMVKVVEHVRRRLRSTHTALFGESHARPTTKQVNGSKYCVVASCGKNIQLHDDRLLAFTSQMTLSRPRLATRILSTSGLGCSGTEGPRAHALHTQLFRL